MKAIPSRSSGFLVMISYILGTQLYGEPYSTRGNTVGYSGNYTGRYTMVLLVSVLVWYGLWIGVQLPQGMYVSYGRGYILVTVGCNIGYTSYGGLITFNHSNTVPSKGPPSWTALLYPTVHILPITTGEFNFRLSYHR